MTCEIGVVRGATRKEVESNKFNIFMGISLNNKWFSNNNIKEYILWGIKHTKNKFGVEIADTLHSINYEVRSKYSKEAAINKSLKEGDKIAENVKKIISELPKEQRKMIDLIRWEDVKKDDFYKKSIKILLEEYQINVEFKSKIKKIVRNFTNKLEGNFTEEKIEKLGFYVVNELPALMNGYEFEDTFYNCWIYPEDGPLLEFVEKIQKKEVFPEFHHKMEIKNNVFVELKVK